MVTLWLNMRAQAPGSSVLTHEYLLDISKAPSPPSFQILAYSLYTDRVLPPPPSNLLLSYYLNSSLLPSPSLDSVVMSSLQSAVFFFLLCSGLSQVSLDIFSSLTNNESLHPNNGAVLLAISVLHLLLYSYYV